jgi:hypothetical protein
MTTINHCQKYLALLPALQCSHQAVIHLEQQNVDILSHAQQLIHFIYITYDPSNFVLLMLLVSQILMFLPFADN